MAGDKFTASVYAMQRTNQLSPPPTTIPNLETLIANLFSSGVLTSGIKDMSGAVMEQGLQLPAILEFLNTQDNFNYSGNAYLNWILLDEEQLKLVSNNSNFTGLGTSTTGSKQLLTSNEITVERNGYLLVYVSNSSLYMDAYFDDLHIKHKRGPVLEETHYYPFGLTMEGVCSKAATSLENQYKYNGKEEQANEFSDGFGLEWLDYGARMYDKQTGRFFSVDPLATLSTRWSSYSYGYNNPIRFIDVDGMYVDDYDYDDDYDGVQDWFRKDGTNKMVYFPGLDEQSTPEGYTWFAKRFSGTDSEGRDVWADEYGNILYDNPHWENLPAVTVGSSYNPSNDGNESLLGDILTETENHFNGGLGTVGVAVQGYNKIPNDVKRHYAYKLSKATGVKSGKIFQGAKSFANSTGKVVSKLGPLGAALGIGVIGYELKYDKWDAHTVVNAGLMIGAGVATFFAAPAVLTGIAIYGVGDYFFDFGGVIDRNLGRNSGIWGP